jgi:hypothetical protein
VLQSIEPSLSAGGGAPRFPRLQAAAIGVVYALFLAIAAYMLWGPRDNPWAVEPALPKGVTAPSQAILYANALSDPNINIRRAAVGPYEAGAVPEFPQGSTVVFDPEGWRQVDHFAIATGTIIEPGNRRFPQIFGYQQFGTTWRIIFWESLTSYKENAPWIPVNY